MAHIVVIGLGIFGRTVAQEVAKAGHQVLGIDSSAENVAEVADVLAQAVTADATDEDVLRELGVAKYDAAVVAIGQHIEASILTTLLLKDLKIPKVWVKARDWSHHRILARLGADRIIHPEYDVGCRTAQQLVHEGLEEYIEFGAGRLVMEVRAPGNLSGRKPEDLTDVQVLAHRRGDVMLPAAETIQTGDHMLVLGTRASLGRFDGGS
jgi:trk system potassium uptake protein TrkA